MRLSICRKGTYDNKHELIKLQKTQVQRFYLQEFFYDYSQLKKLLFVLVCLMALGEFSKHLIVPSGFFKVFTLWENVCVLSAFIVSWLLYGLSFFLKIFGHGTAYFKIRSAMLLSANLLFCFYTIALRYFYFKSLNPNADTSDLLNGIPLFASGTYVSQIIDLVNPIWYTKALVPISYYISYVIGSYQLNKGCKVDAWIKFTIAAVTILLINWFRGHFRWKLFQKREEDESLTKIHEQILNHVPSPIAVFDIKGKISYSNYKFNKVSNNDSEAFLRRVTGLKMRRTQKEQDESEVNLDFSRNLDASPSQKSHIVSKMASSDLKVQTFIEIVENGNLNELLQKAWELLKEANTDDEVSLIFDGVFIEESVETGTKKFSFEVTLSVMMEYQRIILILRDTTEQAKIMALETNSAYKDKLLASVSHELRTPLNGNLSFIEAATNSEDMPPALKTQFLIPAYRSGKLLLSLINDILDSSQIAANKLRLNFEVQSIKNTILSCHQLVELQAKKKGIKMRLSLDENLGDFSTDHDRVRQIILNLLSNAVKFTYQGSVILKAKMITPVHIKITVRDTGIGIKKENLCKLFKDYTRINDVEHMNINSKGVGLGLTIAYKLAKRLGPSTSQAGIKVKSEFGQGSSFSFILVDKAKAPLRILFPSESKNSIDNNGSMEAIDLSLESLTLSSIKLHENVDVEKTMRKYTYPSYINQITGIHSSPYVTTNKHNTCFSNMIDDSPTANQLRKKRILIVDDEPFNILAMESFLKGFDIRIDTAFNGKDAIKKVNSIYQSSARTECYDLIFMDCQMPVMDGFEASKVLNEMMEKKLIPETKIIACTAFNSGQDFDACYRAGMKQVLKKPLSKGQLEDIIKCFLGNP